MTMTPTVTLDSLIEEIRAHPVNTHRFFRVFRDRALSPDQLRTFTRQYHLFCHRFVKLLEGLLYHTPVEALDMRIGLAKTLNSELGDGKADQAHIRHLERFAQRVGLPLADLLSTEPIPELRRYLEVLSRLFLASPYLVALGAELAVETTAISEFRFLLPGLRKYPQFEDRDLWFFSMHLQEETLHGDWLTEAVRQTASSPDDLALVAQGARETVDAWQECWDGFHREIFQDEPLPVIS